MNANSNSDMIAPKWLFLALGVGVMMLTGAVWWASSGDRAPKAKVDVEEYPVTGAGPERIVDSPYVSVPPADASPPWVSGDSSAARVTVTPTAPVQPKTIPQLPGAAKPVVKPKTTKTDTSIRGMFPVGPIVPRDTQRTAAKVEDKPEVPEESFPGFSYGGTTWSFAGAYADAAQLELTPTGLELGGRGVFVLANSTGPTSVMFVQSSRRPGMFAIYR